MDSLSIFSKEAGKVTLASDENNTIDTVVEALGDIKRELKLKRKGDEAFIYGEDLEDTEEVDLQEVEDD